MNSLQRALVRCGVLQNDGIDTFVFSCFNDTPRPRSLFFYPGLLLTTFHPDQSAGVQVEAIHFFSQSLDPIFAVTRNPSAKKFNQN